MFTIVVCLRVHDVRIPIHVQVRVHRHDDVWVIENVVDDCWFTEKLLDSFLSGTIPIYCGCPTIGDFFDLQGMLLFTSVDELVSQVLDDANLQATIVSGPEASVTTNVPGCSF
jgi:hypothetical protein